METKRWMAGLAFAAMLLGGGFGTATPQGIGDPGVNAACVANPLDPNPEFCKEGEDYRRCYGADPCPTVSGSCLTENAGEVCVGLYYDGETTMYQFTETGVFGICGVFACDRSVTVRAGDPILPQNGCRFKFFADFQLVSDQTCYADFANIAAGTVTFCPGTHDIEIQHVTGIPGYRHTYVNWFKLGPAQNNPNVHC